ncbi:hypothetical protein Trisim1_004986 [Trichoderma cf. simile WF8]
MDSNVKDAECTTVDETPENLVKIRGQRVELAEIEHVLQGHRSVRDAVVIVQQQQKCRDDPHHIAQLVGFITLGEEQSIDGNQKGPSSSLATRPLLQQLKEKVIGEFQKFLKLRLPSYMIPQDVVAREEMLVNISGKVDHQALAKNIQTSTATATIKVLEQQPVTRAEQKMQEVWCHVLNMDSTFISLDDNFFELGGNSILAMKAVGMARGMDMKLTVADMFRHGSLKQLSHYISFGDLEKFHEH